MSFVRQTHICDPVRTAQPAVGLVAGTQVMTMDGVLPVDYLTPGDRILTRSGVRKLNAVSVRVETDVAMVRITAGTIGHDRPCADTLVPVHQMMLVRDWRATALYGAPQAFVAAGRLADGVLNRIEILPQVRVFTLTFAEEVVIYAGGLELACLAENVGA